MSDRAFAARSVIGEDPRLPGLDGRDEVLVALEGIRGEEQLADQPRTSPPRSTALKSLRRESARSSCAPRRAASLTAETTRGVRSVSESTGRFGVVVVRRLAQAASPAGALTSAGSAALAMATRPANASASDTASSARILRSTSTPAGLQALDEAVVRDVVGPSSSVDTRDPQLAELTLARAAVPVRVGERVELLLLGLGVQT